MRNKAKLLQDAIRETDKGVTIPEFNDKLTLLELEVLIDIRDTLYNRLSHINRHLRTISEQPTDPILLVRR